MTPDNALNLCKRFLMDYFGVDKRKPVHGNLGLRLVCLGNPERTVQGELLWYLRSAKKFAVSECGVSGEAQRRNPDIIIFDRQWKPVCAVELKHYTANQGKAATLDRTIFNDWQRHKYGPTKDLPVILIGLFTEISRVAGAPSKMSPLYRALRSYGTRTVKQPINGGVKVAEQTMTNPEPCAFKIKCVTVTGRVGWVVRLIRPSQLCKVWCRAQLARVTDAPPRSTKLKAVAPRTLVRRKLWVASGSARVNY